MARKIVGAIPVNDYATVHPALDFYDGKAILSIGGKWLVTYDNGDVDFENKPFCIISNGDKFRYSKKELALRHLFHSGYLDIPVARWTFNDIEKFDEYTTVKNFPEIYEEIYKQFQYYMDFPDKRVYSLFSCFVIYTYFYPLFNTAPILQLWGEFKTGKTKICALLEAMIFNPINSANISSASVFRLIESRRSSILLDESEDLISTERTKDIRNMLLAGTGKSGETFRQEKSSNDSFHTQSYKVFSPKVIANIAGIEIPALQSRVIRITTLGTKNKIKQNREVSQEDKKWGAIRNNLYCLCLTQFNEVIARRDFPPPHDFSGRTLGIWNGIFTIASLVGEKVFEEMKSYAAEDKERIDSGIEEVSEEPTLLLGKLVTMVEKESPVRVTPEELLYEFRDFDISSKRDLALKLGRFGLHTRVLFLNGRHARYYTLVKSELTQVQEQR